MKKVIISSICLLSCLTLAGCSSNDSSQAVKNLNSQLDKTTDVVNTVDDNEISQVSYLNTYNANGDDNYANKLQDLKSLSYRTMLEEEYLRQDILSMSSYLKSNKTKYKLNKDTVTALNNLTSDIDKYTDYISDSKSDVDNYVKQIKKYTQGKSLSAEKATSAYQSLFNIMNERKAYLNNLLNTMSEVANLLYSSQNQTSNTPNNENIANNNYNNFNNYNNYNNFNNGQNIDWNYYPQYQNQDTNNLNENNNNLNNSKDDENNNTKNNTGIKSNIDTYLNKDQSTNKAQNKQLDYNYEYTKNNYTGNNYQNNNLTNNYQNYRNRNYNNWTYNNQRFNPYNYPYNNQYYQNNLNRRFNPNRNTDSFYPLNRNIDTYRYMPYNYNNGYNNGNQFDGAYINTINLENQPVQNNNEKQNTEQDSAKNQIKDNIKDSPKNQNIKHKNRGSNLAETSKNASNLIKHIIKKDNSNPQSSVNKNIVEPNKNIDNNKLSNKNNKDQKLRINLLNNSANQNIKSDSLKSSETKLNIAFNKSKDNNSKEQSNKKTIGKMDKIKFYN